MNAILNGHLNLDKTVLRGILSRYNRPDLGRSLWQIVNTVLPYLALFYLMLRSVEISYWLTLALAFPTAGDAKVNVSNVTVVKKKIPTSFTESFFMVVPRINCGYLPK